MKTETLRCTLVVPYSGFTKQEGTSKNGNEYANVRVLWATTVKRGEKEIREMHSGTIPRNFWDGLVTAADPLTAADELIADVVVEIPQEADPGYNDALAHRGDPARQYVSGNVVEVKWPTIDIKRCPFRLGALPTYDKLPVYIKKSDRPAAKLG